MFALCFVELKQVCHLWRKEGAVASSEGGVVRDQTAKGGHWNQRDAVDRHYLDSALPLELIRQRAGHVQDGHSYFLNRARVGELTKVPSVFFS